jgi:hypothetical protein
LAARSLRRAFAAYADNHAAASIARAWTASEQFFSFLVADPGFVKIGDPVEQPHSPTPTGISA